ncbi:MAG: TPM domain-containing protein [Bacteroidota bacterium]|nr:TPM domain-containing protein [Bacteroidota bacterium]
MKRYGLMTVLLLVFVISAVQGQTLLPRPDPPRLVNDYAGILSTEEAQALENKLVAFNDSTSNQIAVVIVNDLQGYDRSDFAYRVARDWGIGQGDFNNGLLVLVKPKTASSSGQVFIATGYGLEGAIPDLACADIIDNEIIPRFRENDYYGGIDAGTNVLMALASGEYSYGDRAGGASSGAIPGVVIFLIILFFIIIVSAGSSNNKHLRKSGSSNIPLWLLMSMMGGGKSHGGSWGGFSGGSGGGGGFGGFGGGSFGGGGAGGSW